MSDTNFNLTGIMEKNYSYNLTLTVSDVIDEPGGKYPSSLDYVIIIELSMIEDFVNTVYHLLMRNETVDKRIPVEDVTMQVYTYIYIIIS